MLTAAGPSSPLTSSSAPAAPSPPISPRHGPAGNKPPVLPSDAPSEQEATAVVHCIAGFGRLPTGRQITRKPGVPIPDPDTAATRFTLVDLERFFEVKRQNKAEFTPDLLSRMVTAASPSQTIDAMTLRFAASIGPYCHAWRHVIALCETHARRADSARSRAREVQRVIPAPPTGPSSSTSQHRRRSSGAAGASVPRIPSASRPTGSRTGSAALTARGAGRPTGARPGTSDTSATPRKVQRKASAAAAAAGTGSSTARAGGRGDEFRDANGRKRLFLPVVSHPSWSQHADEEWGDRFDDSRRDASGRTLRQFVAEENERSMARTVRMRPNRSGIVDCGTTMVVGRLHPRVSHGALVVDTSQLNGRGFLNYFSEHTNGPQPLPIADAWHARHQEAPASIRDVSTDVMTRRIDESISRVVAYLDDTC